MTDRFTRGSDVWHKSGGPKMTVIGYDDYGDGRKVKCRWWDAKTKGFDHELFFDEELVDQDPIVVATRQALGEAPRPTAWG